MSALDKRFTAWILGSGPAKPIQVVAPHWDLADTTQDAAHAAFTRNQPVMVFEGQIPRRVLHPPDRELIDDLRREDSEYGFILQRRKGTQGRNRWSPIRYSPWSDVEDFDSARAAVAAMAKRTRYDLWQVTWCDEPILRFSEEYLDGQNTIVLRLICLVRTFGLNGTFAARRAHTEPKGKNIYLPGPRVDPFTLRLIPPPPR